MKPSMNLVVVLIFALLNGRAFGTDQPTNRPSNSFQFGFSKVDITPLEPIRLSGYGSRSTPLEGVDEKLFVRAMAMRAGDQGPIHVLLSVETIGFPGILTEQIFEQLRQKHAITRKRFVACFTHDHTAPHIDRGLSNLFGVPLTEQEQQKIAVYTDGILDRSVEAVDQAIADLQPGRLLVSQGKATFARNRRVIKDGVWTGFGENPDGPVDHTLPVIRITDFNNNTRGLLFNYACHCTTFGGEYNRVNGDWAGYAMKYLEEDHPGAMAICTIGCGADANPQRDSKRALELAQSQGKEISLEIKNLLAEPNRWTGIETSTPLGASRPAGLVQSNYGFAGLPIDRPNRQQLEEAINNPSLQVRNHAQEMLKTMERMGRLPETYPMPIQIWRFGDVAGLGELDVDHPNNQAQFAMVFLGGEVCVDYALRIKRELAEQTDGLNQENIWVSAYCNDVFGYVAPERMQSEGGYEVDFSMIYYLQPGRWSSGTEEIILQRVHELFSPTAVEGPRSIEQALESFQTKDNLEVRVLACEPVVRDPINLCVDASGQLWVVEMGDYPRGNPSEMDPHSLVYNQRGYSGDQKPWDGPPGGRIKLLTDTDGDGQFDHATVFLDGLKFPTGVFPWKDGLLVCAAPDIFLARDTDGDGKCDQRELLYTGFSEANPQHRVNGFEWGLDGWLYLAAGNHGNGEVTSVKTGQTIRTSGRDLRIHPETGAIEAISGASQWGRCRDDFGNWFGNDNTRPLYQFVIEERHLKRNPYVASPAPRTT